MSDPPAELSALDRRLLKLLQEDLPLSPDPWGELGAVFGLSGQEVLAKLEQWQARGLIRKIGPSVNPRALGWFSTLCAVNAPPHKLAAIEAWLQNQAGITHCYVRDNARYNLWFTIIAPTEDAAMALAKDFSCNFELDAVQSFPAKEVFKIKAVFDLNKRGQKS